MKKQVLFLFILAIMATMWTSTVRAEDYNLWIAGAKVTPQNCNDLSVLSGVSGTVKYDDATKTLMLQDATINGGEDNGITSGIEGLKIKIIGNNSVTSEEYTALQVDKPASIIGGGNLDLQGKSSSALYVRTAGFIIDNCTVNAKGLYGIAGISGNYGETLTIRNATVTAEGTKGSVCDLANMTMTGCSITQPEGAKFDETKHAVVLNGEKVKSQVVITKDSNAIDTPTADTTAKQCIYTFEGVRLNGSFGSLSKGIYIVNGRKVVKK